MQMIDLEKVSGGSPNLIGRERGEKARSALEIDRLDQERDQVVVVRIPPEVYAVSSSFVLGLFSRSIDALGPEQFRNRYKFDASQSVLQQIEHGIERACVVPGQLVI